MNVGLHRGHPNVALIVAALAALVSVGVFGAMIIWRSSISQEVREQVQSNCEGIEALKAVIRASLLDSRGLVLSNPKLDPAQKSALLAYYKRRLDSFAAIQC